MFRIIIEYANGIVEQYDVAEKLWYRFLMPALEADDNVMHYTVSKLRVAV